MKTHRLLLTALLACFLSPALAEEELFVEEPGARAGLEADAAHPREGVRIFHRRHAQPVKNAPYSAQAVSERLQQLPDGNQIERRTSAASYRDSAGRTRHEVRGKDGEVQVVTINDPVANTTWILTPRTRTAQKLPSRADIGRSAGAAAYARIEQLRKEGRLPRLEREAGAERKAGERTDVHVERENDGRRETVRVIRIPRGTGPDTAGVAPHPAPHIGMHFGPHFGPQLGAIVANAAGDMKWAMKATSRDLGTRDFDGVRAEGKMRSYEIPAGEVGNRNPIVVASESWYSPDLQVTVYSKHSDPRSGDYVYRLEGLKRGEPDAALFKVPSDYKVTDIAAMRGEIRREIRRELLAPGKSGEQK